MPDHYVAMLGHLELVWLLAGAQHMRALRMSHCLTLVSPPSGTCRVAGLFCCVFVCVVFCLLFSCFASARGFLTVPLRVVDLDDRQCFTARSAMR